MTPRTPITRRQFLSLSAAAGLASTLPAEAREVEGMRTRRIPRTGEELPVIGLGTSQTFDVGPSDAERAPLVEVLRTFLDAGGRVIDSSPMYGRAEEVTGDLVARLGAGPRPFYATKVWTRGKAAGAAQIAESMRRMRADPLDLLQVHNLLDWKVQLGTLRELKAAGRIRYVGITHYTLSSFEELERLVRTEKLDFIQLPYSVATREAERRLLPAAAETGTAVLVMRPFEDGDLFRAVRGRPLPAWAAEVGATAWSELFLKFILAHPAVTAVLPATAKLHHLKENVRAGFGPLPDEALRKKIVEAVG
jgi:aryl-alcohol dehydrogenase-like predicted oxidoreductase